MPSDATESNSHFTDDKSGSATRGSLASSYDTTFYSAVHLFRRFECGPPAQERYDDLSVADLAGSGCLPDGFDYLTEELVGDRSANFDFWDDGHFVFGAPVNLLRDPSSGHLWGSKATIPPTFAQVISSANRAFSSAVAMAEITIESINAVTLAVHDMSRSVRFYVTLGFSIRYGGEHAAFTSLHAGSCYLNLIGRPAGGRLSWWGRVIFHVSDVDALHRRARDNGLAPTTAPADAPWGERYFHISDPDGHELSFARPIKQS